MVVHRSPARSYPRSFQWCFRERVRVGGDGLSRSREDDAFRLAFTRLILDRYVDFAELASGLIPRIDAHSVVPLNGETNTAADQDADEKTDPNQADARDQLKINGQLTMHNSQFRVP